MRDYERQPIGELRWRPRDRLNSFEVPTRFTYRYLMRDSGCQPIDELRWRPRDRLSSSGVPTRFTYRYLMRDSGCQPIDELIWRPCDRLSFTFCYLIRDFERQPIGELRWRPRDTVHLPLFDAGLWASANRWAEMASSWPSELLWGTDTVHLPLFDAGLWASANRWAEMASTWPSELLWGAGADTEQFLACWWLWISSVWKKNKHLYIVYMSNEFKMKSSNFSNMFLCYIEH